MTTMTDAVKLARPQEFRAIGIVVKLRGLEDSSDEVEQLGHGEFSSVPLDDRIGPMDGDWLLPDVAREDSDAPVRQKRELRRLLRPDGPNHHLIEDWKKRFPPSVPRAAGGKSSAKMGAASRDEDDSLNGVERTEGGDE